MQRKKGNWKLIWVLLKLLGREVGDVFLLGRKDVFGVHIGLWCVNGVQVRVEWMFFFLVNDLLPRAVSVLVF